MIYIMNEKEQELMRESCNIVKCVLELLEENIKPGISTYELDKIAEKYILSRGGKPNFKGEPNMYGNPYPGTICASVNDEIIHGIPSKSKILKQGDIISIDCGAVKNGFHGDAARTFAVGNISKDAKNLIEVTKQSFFEGINKAVIGNRIGDISNAIQTYVEAKGYSIVKEYQGHGIGRNLHEEPDIPNYGKVGKGPRLMAGMALAIEPMVNIGDSEISLCNDNWTVRTKDSTLSAHYENTILITKNGIDILTL